MPRLLPLKEVSDRDGKLVGGKGLSLARLARGGFLVPRTICVTSEAYRMFVNNNGLAERIQLELSRKNLAEMRWEEIWDTALRIRNLFLTNPMDQDLESSLSAAISKNFGQGPVAVRSSAPEEDSASSSFAGVHESFINISGTAAILDHIRLVWASLWSDAALLYRQELGLLTGESTMAVVVQEVIDGRSSGILFTRSPTDAGKCAIEAVYGLNQALVDGLIEPDRWLVDRSNGKIESAAVSRSQYLAATADGVELRNLPQKLRGLPPLSEEEARQLYETGLAIEKFYGAPQDIEWTHSTDGLVILQARPISTAAAADSQDKRPWYLSLHRSLENLQELQAKIEKELLPAMSAEADTLNRINLLTLADGKLADELERRMAVNEKWTAIYWRDFIPFAHGMRLFGQVYNDTVRPENPYEFVDLLVHTPLQSVKRNLILEKLADRVRQDSKLRGQLAKGATEGFVDHEFAGMLKSFIERYGDLSCSLGLADNCRGQIKTLLAVIVETAANPPAIKQRSKRASDLLVENYLNRFPADKREEALEVLELGRASYRLRDDDNIYIGRIESELARAIDEANDRLEKSGRMVAGAQVEVQDCLQALRDPDFRPKIKPLYANAEPAGRPNIKARQLLGQPAGPGMARGIAKVVNNAADLGSIKKGDILICDAIEPNMTFVVPLASAIVERRGGMLIHGAIIAREYGIPCVTGIPEATKLISSGDELNVDGYLGIVTILAAKQ